MCRITAEYPSATIIRETADGRVAYYPDGSVTLPRRARYMELTDQENCWLILDAVAKAETPVARVLVVASPKQDDWKRIKFDAYKIRYMPPWTLTEVQAWNALTGSKISNHELRQRFIRWGGVPRTLAGLSDVGTKNDLHGVFTAEHAKAAFIMQGHTTCRNLPTGEITGKILHIFPTDQTLSTTSICFATAYIRERCMLLLLMNARSEMRRMLAVIDPGTLKGLLFESFAHRVLLAGGTFEVSRIYTSTDQGPI